MFYSKCQRDIKEKKQKTNNQINSTKDNSEWSSFSIEKENPAIEIECLKSFIGNNKNWIQKKFSPYAAIFGPFYLIYRKMHKQAFIMIIIYLITYIYIPDTIGIILRLLMNIFLAFTINKYYYDEAINQINIIRKNNNDKNTKEILNLCEKQGGNYPITIIIIIFIIYLTIIFLSSYYAQNNHIFQISNNKILYKTQLKI